MSAQKLYRIAMSRNIEIKAHVRDLDLITKKAKELSNSNGELIVQHDIFYNANHGRLKLRKFTDRSSTLVYYDRPDTAGPKLSNYDKCDIPAPNGDYDITEKLNSTLSQSLGVKGELRKKRVLYMVGQTRVHIDNVEGLGDFMELEVVLRPEQTVAEGQEIANELQSKLGVKNEDLLTGAYMDMILNKSQ